MIVGAVISRTTIVPLQVAALPQSSVAVHVRVTLYVPAHEPAVVASEKVIVTLASQLSIAVAIPKSGTAGQSIMLANSGHEIVGGVESSTVIVCAHVLVLPHSSSAVHVLVIVYP